MLPRYAHHPAFAISTDTISGPLPATVLLPGGVWLLQQLKRTSHYRRVDDFSRHSSHKQPSKRLRLSLLPVGVAMLLLLLLLLSLKEGMGNVVSLIVMPVTTCKTLLACTRKCSSIAANAHPSKNGKEAAPLHVPLPVKVRWPQTVHGNMPAHIPPTTSTVLRSQHTIPDSTHLTLGVCGRGLSANRSFCL